VFGDAFFYDAFSKRYNWYYQPNRWEYKICQKVINFSNLDVLEVGCGDGHFLERIKMDANTSKGLELNTQAVETAQQKGLDVEAETIQAFAKAYPEAFDVVAMFQVLEHIGDVRTFLESSIACLKPGGKLLIAVPNNASILLKTKPNLVFINELHQRCTLMNMPPHHMGRWDSKSLTALSGYLPVRLHQFYYEPIWYYRTHYLELLQCFDKRWLSKFFKKENLLFKTYFKLAQPRIKGHTILGIYIKH
jgi:SAM-dependent methyltransferase